MKYKTIVMHKILILFIFSSTYIFIYELIGFFNGIIDFNFTKESIMAVILLFSTYFIANLYKKNYKNPYHNILKYFFYAGALHSIIIIVTALSPSIKIQLYNILYTTKLQHTYILNPDYPTRLPGLLPSGFASLSTTQGLLFSIGLLSITEIKTTSLIQVYKNILLLSLIFISVILTGRSGLVIVIVFTLFFLCIYLGKAYRYKIIHKAYISTLLLMFTVITIFILANISYILHNNTLNHALEPILSLLGMYTSKTPTSVQYIYNNMLIFPNNPFSFIFGSGDFGRGTHIIPSDLGIVYLINGAGLIGTSIAFAFLLIPISFKTKTLKIYKYYILTIGISIILLNFKDLYLWGFGGELHIYLIMAIMYDVIKKENVNTKEYEHKGSLILPQPLNGSKTR